MDKSDYLEAIKNTNSVDFLRGAGEALYGRRWQSSLAEDLMVSDRTMRRWVAGTHPVPADVYGDLLHLMKSRLWEINIYVEALEEAGVKD